MQIQLERRCKVKSAAWKEKESVEALNKFKPIQLEKQDIKTNSSFEEKETVSVLHLQTGEQT
jgi:hypothetical protein